MSEQPIKQPGVIVKPKEAMIDTVNALPEDATWADVKRSVNAEIHNHDNSLKDGSADAIAATVVIAVIALVMVFWISG